MDDALERLHVTNDQIGALCQKWKIVRFELFGSAIREDFDEQSDVDVLVVFADESQIHLRDLVEMEGELATLFGHPVDLVKRHLIEDSRNWIRRKAILSTAQLVYAAA